jgi:peptidoglycan/LPS O-acetylase OafA/YrhL
VKSSEGVHYVGLDHVRALAVFLVFGYHMLEAARETGASLPDAHSFFLNSLLNQGHTGVALFMTLSGYLFSRLTEGKSIAIGAFLKNRSLRLFPLLLVVLLVCFGLENLGPAAIVQKLILGLVFPIWPNGTWSIIVEIHFYLIFPVLLILSRRSPWPLLWVLLAALVCRYAIYLTSPERVQSIAYWTIFGRIDQFILGMILARAGNVLTGKNGFAATIAICFIISINSFDGMGGIHSAADLSSLWVWWPSFEGLSFAILIAWYDRSFNMPNTGLSQMIARIGQWSYSIYLLHFFFVWKFVGWIDRSIFAVDRFDQVLALTLIAFPLMLIPAAFSYRFIEHPFLKRRIKYLSMAEVPNEMPSVEGLAGVATAR